MKRSTLVAHSGIKCVVGLLLLSSMKRIGLLIKLIYTTSVAGALTFFPSPCTSELGEAVPETSTPFLQV